MGKRVKGTQTEKNLLISFAGESQARMRYTYFSEAASKEGYEQIASIFMETAEQERVHAKRMFQSLEGGILEIKASYPAGIISTTIENLKLSVRGEHQEWYIDYPKFADIAEEEGLMEIARMYRHICIAEQGHEERYLTLLNRLEEGTVFKKEENTMWICRKCGYIYYGKEAPRVCPACFYPQAYFEVKPINY